MALLQFEGRTEVTPRLAKPRVGGLLHRVLLLLFPIQLRESWCHWTGLDQSRAGRGVGDVALPQNVTCHTLGFRFLISGRQPRVTLQTGNMREGVDVLVAVGTSLESYYFGMLRVVSEGMEA